jgi:hypothetical protein
MADTKVSLLTSRTARVGTEQIPVADGGANYRMSVNDILKGIGGDAPLWLADIYLGPSTAGSATGAMAADRLHMMPVRVPILRTFTTLAIVLTDDATATGSIVLGLYNSDPDSLQPSTLIYEGDSAITVDVGTALGLKTTTINGGTGVSLTPGIYYLASLATGSGISVHRPTADSGEMGWYLSGTTVRRSNGLYRAYTYGNLPGNETSSTFTGSGVGNINIPAVWIR